MKVNFSPFSTDLYLWNGMAAVFFSNAVTIPHSHNTLQIIFDLQNNFKCRVKGGKWGNYNNLIISENLIHQLDTNGSAQLIIYLDTGTTISKKLKDLYLREANFYSPGLNIYSIVKPDELQNTLLNSQPAILEKLINKLLLNLIGIKEAISIDERINKVQKLIQMCHLAEIDINFLADKVYLSKSRLRSLFKEKTGVSLHRYIIWARIRFAINSIMTGNTVSVAALEAGFADSSHFHKMLVQMFGISPSQFLRNNQFFKAVNCDPTVMNFETKV